MLTLVVGMLVAISELFLRAELIRLLIEMVKTETECKIND